MARALVLELKILSYTRKHLNLVNLLGAVTKKIKTRKFLQFGKALRNHFYTLFFRQTYGHFGIWFIRQCEKFLKEKSQQIY